MNGDILTIGARLGVLRFLADKIKDRQKETGGEFTSALPPGTRLPVMIGDTHIGWVTIPQPTRKAAVTDEAAYLAWAEKRAPTEVEDVRQVRPSFTAVLLREVKEHGGWPDKEKGERIQVPGVTAGVGDPYVKVDFTDGAEQAIADAWAGGLREEVGAMLALPAGKGAA